MNRALALVALAGCGGEATAPDAGGDARTVVFPTCDPALDDMWFERLIAFEPPDQGRDLDGDGDVDNIVGTQRDFLNPLLEQRIADGTLLVLFALPGLSTTPTVEPLEIAAYWPLAQDADHDPANNTITSEFLISLSIFDASCAPHSPMTAVQTGLSYHAESDGGGFAGQVGLFNLQDAVFDGTIESDGSLTTHLTGAYPVCALDRAAAGGALPGSTLDILVVALGLQPDIDADADGLERFESEDGIVARCIDGDGTVLEGSSCPCDPAIADGYSAAVRFEAIPANIVGTYP